MNYLSSSEACLRLGYWVENHRMPFPEALIGCEAWCHNKRLGIVQGGRRDDCLSLLVTDQGEYVARHVDCLLATAGGGK